MRPKHRHQYCNQYLKTRVPISSKLTHDIFYLYNFTFLCLIQSHDDDDDDGYVAGVNANNTYLVMKVMFDIVHVLLVNTHSRKGSQTSKLRMVR